MSAISDYSAVHRELWPNQRAADQLYAGSPAFGLIKKATDLSYEGIHITPQYGRGQGRARGFAKAQSRASAPKYGDFFVKASDDYATFDLTGKLIRSNKNSDAFVINTLERESRDAMNILKRSQHVQLMGDGTATRGAIAAGGIAEAAGLTTITLANAADVKNFELGQYVTAAATAVGALRDTGAAYPVATVNLAAGTIVLTGTAATTSSWAAADFLFSDGDALNAGSDVMLQGFRAWIPDSAPSATTFFGVNRAVAPELLAGWRFTAAALSTTTILSTIQAAASQMSRAGQVVMDDLPRVCLINGEDMGTLMTELEATAAKNETFKRKGNDVDAYYEGVKIFTPIGTVECFIEGQQQQGRVMLINPESWTYHTIGAQPEFVEEDGLRMLRKAASDAYETRLVVHPQLSCDMPVANANILLPT